MLLNDLESVVVLVSCARFVVVDFYVCVCVRSTQYIFRCVHYSICVMKEVVGISKLRYFKCWLDVSQQILSSLHYRLAHLLTNRNSKFNTQGFCCSVDKEDFSLIPRADNTDALDQRTV